jgi:hypothetical protein
MNKFKKIFLINFLFVTVFSVSEVCLAQAIQVNTLNNLVFTDVIPGINKEVLITDPVAAQYQIYSDKTRTIWISFSLPVNLISGNKNLPVTFDNSHTGYNSTNNPIGSTFINPNQTTSITIQKNQTLYVWVGGTVTSALAASSGSYSASVRINVSY